LPRRQNEEGLAAEGRQANEFLDCEVYALHAARALRIDTYTSARWTEMRTSILQGNLFAPAVVDPGAGRKEEELEVAGAAWSGEGGGSPPPLPRRPPCGACRSPSSRRRRSARRPPACAAPAFDFKEHSWPESRWRRQKRKAQTWLDRRGQGRHGQEYTIGTRTPEARRPKEIREQVKFWDGKVKELDRGTSGMRVRGRHADVSRREIREALRGVKPQPRRPGRRLFRARCRRAPACARMFSALAGGVHRRLSKSRGARRPNGR
jgi:hypothetical protein